MPSREIQDFVEYIQQVMMRTRTGKMKWLEANSTTFTWEAPEKSAKLNLQQILPSQSDLSVAMYGLDRTQRYLLQAIHSPTNEVKVTIDGSLDPKLNEELGHLFELISDSIRQKGLDFLKSILPPPG
jgi:hypothetical protein